VETVKFEAAIHRAYHIASSTHWEIIHRVTLHIWAWLAGHISSPCTCTSKLCSNGILHHACVCSV